MPFDRGVVRAALQRAAEELESAARREREYGSAAERLSVETNASHRARALELQADELRRLYWWVTCDAEICAPNEMLAGVAEQCSARLRRGAQ